MRRISTRSNGSCTSAAPVSIRGTAGSRCARKDLLTGLLEPTNEAYALAKITGIKLCQSYRTQYGCDFISAMPTNLYGQNDNFDLTSSHVLPALIRKCHDAKVSGQTDVVIWGSGTPRRECPHVDDLADACLFLMQHYDAPEHINVGVGEDLSIRELAEMVRDIVHPSAVLVFDRDKPDGTPRKLLNVDRLHDLGIDFIDWQCGHRVLVAPHTVPSPPRLSPTSSSKSPGPYRKSPTVPFLDSGGAAARSSSDRSCRGILLIESYDGVTETHGVSKRLQVAPRRGRTASYRSE